MSKGTGGSQGGARGTRAEHRRARPVGPNREGVAAAQRMAFPVAIGRVPMGIRQAAGVATLHLEGINDGSFVEA